MRLQLSIWAEDLPNTLVYNRTPDPFAVVTVLTEDSTQPVLLGQTEVLMNTNSPDWTKLFYIEHFQLGKATTVVVSIYSSHNVGEPVGTATFDVATIIAIRGNTMARGLKDGGIVVAHIEQATLSGMLDFQVRAIDLINVEQGFSMSLSNKKSDPFFELQRLRQTASGGGKRVWDAVFRSTTIANNLDPVWNASSLEVDARCGGQRDQKFQLAIYDYQKDGNHLELGSVLLSLNEMLDKVNDTALQHDKRYMDMNKSFTLTKNGETAGHVFIAKATISGAVTDSTPPVVVPAVYVPFSAPPSTEPDVPIVDNNNQLYSANEPLQSAERREPTFMNYVNGGCDLRVLVGIDYTASNGDPRKDASLHYLKPNGRNSYEEVIFSLCSTLSKYDSDQKFPVWGFGAKMNGQLSHCFPAAGSTAEVNGVDGILQTYRATFRSGLIMSSPRDFSEVIHKAGEDAKKQVQQGQAYSILLLLTNGGPADPEKTVRALQAVDDAPLSVVVVGVGTGPFDSIHDAESRLRSSSNTGGSPKLKFVPASALYGALDHVPEELVNYFVKHNIYPQPETVTEDIVIEPYHESTHIDVPIKINEQGQAQVTGNVQQDKKQQVMNFMKQGKKLMGNVQQFAKYKQHMGKLSQFKKFFR